jgi:L-amino acid N-acyltransferase YncA
MKIVQCEHKRHAAAILAIFNEAIANTTALYDYKPRTMEMMTAWFEAKSKGKYPVIGIEDESGELMGFATYGTWSTRCMWTRAFVGAALASGWWRRSSRSRRDRIITC